MSEAKGIRRLRLRPEPNLSGDGISGKMVNPIVSYLVNLINNRLPGRKQADFLGKRGKRGESCLGPEVNIHVLSEFIPRERESRRPG